MTSRYCHKRKRFCLSHRHWADSFTALFHTSWLFLGWHAAAAILVGKTVLSKLSILLYCFHTSQNVWDKCRLDKGCKTFQPLTSQQKAKQNIFSWKKSHLVLTEIVLIFYLATGALFWIQYENSAYNTLMLWLLLSSAHAKWRFFQCHMLSVKKGTGSWDRA